MIAEVDRRRDDTSAKIIEHIVEAAAEFTEGAPTQDDITAVVIKTNRAA